MEVCSSCPTDRHLRAEQSLPVYSAGRSALAYRSLNQISPFIALIQYGRLQRLLSRDFIADDIEEAMDQLLEVLDCIEYFLQKRETPGSLEEQLGLSNKLRTAAFCCKYLNPDLSAEALSLIKKAFVDLHSVKLYKWPIEAGTITENIDGASKGRSVQEVSLILMRHLDRIGSFVVNAREGRTLGKLNGDVTVIEVPEAQNAKSNEWTSID